MFRLLNKKTKKRITKKVDKALNFNEKKVIRALFVLVVVFLLSFLAVIYFYNDYFRKLNPSPNPRENPAFVKKLDDLVRGYPIESMLPEITQRDEKIAALLISIAKKESDWGKRVPVLNGRDCYNYWGYRGQSDEMGTNGHTCFKSRQEAVNVVARRLTELVYADELDSPQKLVVWKCGDNCDGDNPISVRKWIKDVDYYYQKIME